MEKVIITRFFKSDKNKEGKQILAKGKPAWRVAIQTDKHGDKWFSTLAFAETDAVCNLKEGDEATIVVWEQNGYSNFKLPTKIDFLEARIEAIEKHLRTTIAAAKTEEEKTTSTGYNGEVIRPEDIPF